MNCPLCGNPVEAFELSMLVNQPETRDAELLPCKCVVGSEEPEWQALILKLVEQMGFDSERSKP